MRVLFTTQPGHGHLQPMAPYARALVEAGDEVRVATAESFCPAIEALGLEAVPVGVDFTWERPTRRFPQLAEATRSGTMGEAVREIVWDHWVPSAVDDLLPVVEAWKPDLIVREAAEHAAVFAARLSGIPTVVAAWGAMQTDPVWELAAVPVSVVRAEYERRGRALGLALDADEVWAHEFTLSTLPPSFIPPDLEMRPPVAHFRTPPLDGATGEDEWPGPAEGERRLIYATLGTVFGWDREVRSIMLEAFSGVEADVVMTLGRGTDTTRIAAPANVQIEEYVPQSLVLARASAVASHAGLGTMIGAIAAGTPMVLFELGADHAINAQRAVAVGIAETFRREDLDAPRLRAAVERALDDPQRRARAAAVAREYAEMPPAGQVVDVLRGRARGAAGAY